MEKEFGAFRKSAFGGFNRKDVIEYIEKMKNETYEYKLQVEETVKNLNEKICELENAASFIGDSCEADFVAGDSSSVTLSRESVGDISQATRQLKSVADELCKNLGDFIEKLARKGLCDEGKAECEAIEAFDFLYEAEEKAPDKVSQILSAMSFIEADRREIKLPDENKTEKSKDVKEILSVLSFLD